MIFKVQVLPLFNIVIKGLTLLGKFCLVFYIAKYLEPSDIGIYGLLIGFLTYSLYAVGLDFYTYSTRELVKINQERWWKYIKSHIALIVTIYIILLPLIIYIVYKVLGIKWIPFFVSLLILEHLNQELMRLLIAATKNIWANNLNFIRQGLWCFILILFQEFSLITLTLENVLLIWIIFSLLSFSIGTLILSRYIRLKKEKIDFKWIKTGLRVSCVFLIATLCARSITTLDRVWIEYLDGLIIVGAYSLYFSLTNTLIAFLDTGVFSFIYPKMIKDLNNNAMFFQHTKQLAIQTIIFILVIAGGLVLITPVLLDWIGKGIYIKYLSLFYIILIANILYCLSMIFHYILYAHHEDKKLFIAQLLALFIFIISTFLLNLIDIEHAVALGVLFSFAGLLVMKLSYSLFILKNRKNHEFSCACE